MTTPTYQEYITLLNPGGGLASESIDERELSLLAVLASGSNPDGTPAPSSLSKTVVEKLGAQDYYWINAPTGSIYDTNGPHTSQNGETQLVMDGDGASLFYGLSCSCVVPAGYVTANGKTITADMVVSVARGGTSEGSGNPFSSGSVYSCTFPFGQPPTTLPTPILVAAPASASFDLRGTGVAALANGYLVATVVNFGTTVPGGPLVAQNGGITLYYSPDCGVTWSTSGTGTDQPNYNGTIWTGGDASASAIVDLGYGTTYAALGQSATTGVVLQPAHGGTSGYTFETSAYFIGTYTAGSHITWSATLGGTPAPGATVGFTAVEMQMKIYSATNWVALVRNNTASTLYQVKSQNAGTTWGTVTELSTAEYSVSSVFSAPRLLYTSSGITIAGVSRLSPNIALAGKGLYQGYIWSTDAATTTGTTLPTWHGPVTIDETGNQNTGDYGAIMESPSYPGMLYMVYAIPNLATGFSNLLGRFMTIAFSGRDLVGGQWARGLHSTDGDISVVNGILWFQMNGVRNKLLGWRATVPPTTGIGGVNSGDIVLNNAGGIIFAWQADRSSGSLVWHPIYVQSNTTVNAPGATPSINTGATNIATFTGLAAAITSMTTNLTSTNPSTGASIAPVDGQLLTIRLTDNGTARAITWGTGFEASTVALPTTTSISALLTVNFQYNGVTSKWRCIQVA